MKNNPRSSHSTRFREHSGTVQAVNKILHPHANLQQQPPSWSRCQHLVLLSRAEQGERETPSAYTHAHRIKL